MEYELDDELRGVIDHEVRVRGGRCEKPFPNDGPVIQHSMDDNHGLF